MKSRHVIVLTLALLSFGCSNQLDQKIVGKYQGQFSGTGSDQPNSVNASMAGTEVPLELNKDHTWTMNLMIPSSGTWALDGQTLKLTITRVAENYAKDGKDMGTENCTVSDDGSTITAPKDIGGMVFRRA